MNIFQAGQNGVDNGFVIFRDYRIPRENLLNRSGDVTEDGEYVKPGSKMKSEKEKEQRYSASLGALSMGRVGIVGGVTENLQLAVVIAVRYGAVRRQFGPPNSREETPIIEYQTHQCRLFPYLAASFVYFVAGRTMFHDWLNLTAASMGKSEPPEVLAAMGSELHGMSSAAKAVSSWTTLRGIQECREACGGFGYLKAARLSDLRNDTDAAVTFEGDNNVIVQQTSNWLIKLWEDRHQQRILSPFGSVEFLNDWRRLLNKQPKIASSSRLRHSSAILEVMRTLVIRLLNFCHSRFAELERRRPGEGGAFAARNDNQVHSAKTLSIAFVELVALQRFVDETSGYPDDQRAVMERLAVAFGLNALSAHVGHLYEFGIFDRPEQARFLYSGVAESCKELLPDAVGLVDVIAPPDFVLNSVLAYADGRLYENLKEALYRRPGTFERASYWQDIVAMFNKSKL